MPLIPMAIGLLSLSIRETSQKGSQLYSWFLFNLANLNFRKAFYGQ